MKHVHNTIRIVAGVFFCIIFLSKFGVLPSAVHNAAVFTPEGFAFITAVNEAGYIFPIVGLVCLLAGLALLTNKYVAVMAVILVPITFNFAIFHIFLGLPINSTSHFFREVVSYIPLALNLYILYSERKTYRMLLKP